MDINIDKLREVNKAKDRVFTDHYDINGMEIKIGDVIVLVGSKEKYFVNYSPAKKCYYGLAFGNKNTKEIFGCTWQ